MTSPPWKLSCQASSNRPSTASCHTGLTSRWKSLTRCGSCSRLWSQPVSGLRLTQAAGPRRFVRRSKRGTLQVCRASTRLLVIVLLGQDEQAHAMLSELLDVCEIDQSDTDTWSLFGRLRAEWKPAGTRNASVVALRPSLDQHRQSQNVPFRPGLVRLRWHPSGAHRTRWRLTRSAWRIATVSVSTHPRCRAEAVRARPKRESPALRTSADPS